MSLLCALCSQPLRAPNHETAELLAERKSDLELELAHRSCAYERDPLQIEWTYEPLDMEETDIFVLFYDFEEGVVRDDLANDYAFSNYPEEIDEYDLRLA